MTSPSFHIGDAYISSRMVFKLTTLGHTGKPSTLRSLRRGSPGSALMAEKQNQDLLGVG